MSSICFTISGMIFCILLMFAYFFKKRVNNIENRIYPILIIVSLISCIVEISCFLCVQDNNEFLWNIYPLLLKLLFCLFLTWLSFYLYYYYVILQMDKNQKDNASNARRKILIGMLIVIMITAILPFNVQNINGMLMPSGVAVNFLYIIATIYIGIIIVFIIKSLKYIRNKKYWPLLLFISISIFAVVFQMIFPDILLINLIITFTTFVMYFTIENPDVKMIEQLNIAREQADKANQAKTDFLSNMSHEIRTPLNAIVGFSQTLYEEDIPESAKSQVEDIISASNSLLEIVNGILDISKIEANKLEIINDEYNFKKIFDELVSLSRARMGEKPLDFRIHYDESIPEVLYGDKLRIKQVILNILTNSIKYTKEGFIDFTVNSVKKGDVCRLIISVEDSGVGIKKENLDKLFTKFQRFEEKNTTIEGTGLGLAITKKLVELMGGQIIVQSVYGKGSKFTIVLNQKVVLNPVKKQEENPISLDTETFDLTGKKILVVDDNKLNLKVAERLLQKYNLTVEVVASGIECLEKINAKNPYDLIFLDDMMPKMNGVQTLHELKKIENFHIPVVILTANAISGMREKYLQDGFDEYLAKPIERNELNRILKKFLMKEL